MLGEKAIVGLKLLNLRYDVELIKNVLTICLFLIINFNQPNL